MNQQPYIWRTACLGCSWTYNMFDLHFYLHWMEALKVKWLKVSKSMFSLQLVTTIRQSQYSRQK